MKTKLLKSAVISNNVCNGSTSFIQLVEETEHKKTRYVIIINNLNTYIKLYYYHEDYKEAYNEFKKEIELATLL